ncbi:hypothetical protein BD410DRAFT_782869, partial [Rickenella mellea]
LAILFAGHPTVSGPNPKQDLFEFKDLPLHDFPLLRDVKQFVKGHLNEQTFNNHINRLLYLACLLHDIGTASAFLATKKHELRVQRRHCRTGHDTSAGGNEDQADCVCEAVVRHQDIFVTGANITLIGQFFNLATILVRNSRANLIHPTLISTTCAAFPRNRRLALKPWCHTSTFEVLNWKEGTQSKFATDVRMNDFQVELM